MSLLVARQNSARSTTGCSLADRAGTSGGFYGHGGAKLIEASLIRTLAKWSPQNAKTEGAKENAEAGSSDSKQKHIFHRLAAHPSGIYLGNENARCENLFCICRLTCCLHYQ